MSRTEQPTPAKRSVSQALKREPYAFPHERLDIYRVVLQMAKKAKQLAQRIPRGYRSYADQLIRAAGQAVLLVGEGANRFSAGQKRQRFTEARGECGEVAIACDLLTTLSLAPAAEAAEVKVPAGRSAARLTKLIYRHS